MANVYFLCPYLLGSMKSLLALNSPSHLFETDLMFCIFVLLVCMPSRKGSAIYEL